MEGVGREELAGFELAGVVGMFGVLGEGGIEGDQELAISSTGMDEGIEGFAVPGGVGGVAVGGGNTRTERDVKGAGRFGRRRGSEGGVGGGRGGAGAGQGALEVGRGDGKGQVPEQLEFDPSGQACGGGGTGGGLVIDDGDQTAAVG